MIRKQVIICVSLVMILIAGVSSVRGQEKKPGLKDKRITIKMNKKPLFDVFMRLIYDYDVAIGFEESTLDSEHDDYQFETNVPYDGAIKKESDGTTRLVDFG